MGSFLEKDALGLSRVIAPCSQSSIIEAPRYRVKQGIECCRVLNFLDRESFDIAGGEEAKVYASNVGSYRL